MRFPAILSEAERDVNVPGKIINPASKIHVKNEERIVCSLGIVSSAWSMSIYRVCTLFWRFGAPGRGGVGVRCVEEEG